MDCKSLYFICAISSLFFSSIAQSLQNNSLDALAEHYASTALAHSLSGVLYNTTLPANLSGMELSVVRLRSSTLWNRGANYSTFWLPPRIIASPFAKRIVIVFQNLGNWSSHYYRVPGHLLVTPVIGFRAYNDSNFSSNVILPIDINVTGDPILIHFPKLQLPPGVNKTARCVRFNVDGVAFFTNMTLPSMCSTRNPGHFSIVVEQPKRKPREQPKRKPREYWKLWRWWVVVLVVLGGVVGLVSACVVCILVVRHLKAKKITKMERKSDQGETFRTIWIGSSKMPTASVMRTQPVLETGYVP